MSNSLVQPRWDQNPARIFTFSIWTYTFTKHVSVLNKYINKYSNTCTYFYSFYPTIKLRIWGSRASVCNMFCFPHWRLKRLLYDLLVSEENDGSGKKKIHVQCLVSLSNRSPKLLTDRSSWNSSKKPEETRERYCSIYIHNILIIVLTMTALFRTQWNCQEYVKM